MSESRTRRPPQQTGPATSPRSADTEPASPAPELPSALPGPIPRTQRVQPGRLDPFGAFDAAHAAFIGSAAAIADEIAEIMRAGIDSAAELLAAKTIDDVSAVNAGLVRRTVDAALSRSLRLAETGTRLANETWDRLMPMIGASPAA